MGIVDDWHSTAVLPRQRVRIKGQFSPVRAAFFNIDSDCTSGTVETDYGVVAHVGIVQTTRDVVTPNFFQRRARGEFITNPFGSLRETQIASGTYCSGTANTPSCGAPIKLNTYDLTGPQAFWRYSKDAATKLYRPSAISDSDISSAMKVAATACWDKSNEHSADILVDVSEFSKTLKMLRNPLQTTSAFLRKIQPSGKGRRPSFKELADYSNSMWLQYRYGIRPLVASVQGVVEALDKVHQKRHTTHRGSYSLSGTDSLDVSHIGNPFSFDGHFAYTDNLVVRAGLVLEEELSIGRALGVDASGILALPWERVPFSFVADWFANVNNYLGALAPYMTKSPVSSWITLQRKTTNKFNVLSSSAKPGWTLVRGAMESREAIFEEKIRIPALPGPKLSFKPQAFSKVSSDLRIVDAFALVSQQFLKVFGS